MIQIPIEMAKRIEEDLTLALMHHDFWLSQFEIARQHEEQEKQVKEDIEELARLIREGEEE